MRGRRRRHEAPNGDITSGEALLFPAGAEDPEHGASETRGLQNVFASILDDERADSLSDKLLVSQWESARRIRELRDPSVSHDWLWALNRAHGACLSNANFLTAARLRVGFHSASRGIATLKM